MTAPPEPAPGRTGGTPIAGRPPVRPWWLGAVVIAAGVVWLHGAFSLPRTATYAAVGPGLFPALIGTGLVLLGVLLLAAIARGERFEPQEAEDADPDRPPARRAIFLTVVAAFIPIVLIRPLGFPVAAAAAFALTARAFGSTRLGRDLALGFLLGVACWLLFARLLGLPLPGFPFFGRP